jgi:hypothetical protein
LERNSANRGYLDVTEIYVDIIVIYVDIIEIYVDIITFIDFLPVCVGTSAYLVLEKRRRRRRRRKGKK